MIHVAVCMSCVSGLHNECLFPVEESEYLTCCCSLADKPSEGSTDKRAVGRPLGDPDEMKDPLSTGRKRAAMLYPIYEGMICEWAFLRFAGGGPAPVIGCRGNLARDIHHGPDKNTLNNGPENIHRLCTNCHEHFHSLNDKFYGPRPKTPDGKVDATVAFLPVGDCHPHDTQTIATEDELKMSEEYWARNMKKAK